MFISFLGCDGSGKSAVMDLLCARMQERGVTVHRGHWRPVPFSNVGDIANGHAADDPHGQSPRGLFASVLKLGWLWGCWWLGWITSLASASRKGHVMFDRYHIDLLVDPKRYRYGGPMFLARLASHLMPQPDRVFFLDADPDVLLSRKQEVSREALEKSRAAYLDLAKRSERITIIDASKLLDEVVEEVARELLVPGS